MIDSIFAVILFLCAFNVKAEIDIPVVDNELGNLLTSGPLCERDIFSIGLYSRYKLTPDGKGQQDVYLDGNILRSTDKIQWSAYRRANGVSFVSLSNDIAQGYLCYEGGDVEVLNQKPRVIRIKRNDYFTNKITEMFLEDCAN